MMRLIVCLVASLLIAGFAASAPAGIKAGWAAEPARAGAEPFDFNGDGYADLAAPVPVQNVGGVAEAGAVHIVYGSRSGLTVTGSQFLSQASPGIKGRPAREAWFGLSHSSGDFNRDGYADLASSTNRSTLAILYGNREGLGPRDQLLTKSDLGIAWGSISPRPLVAGDFDGDGFSDIALGEPEGGGVVSILMGGRDGLSRHRRELLRESDPGMGGRAGGDDEFGGELAVGDLNGDGRDDLIVTVANPVFEDNPGDQGGFHFIPGSPTGLSRADSRFLTWDELIDDFGVRIIDHQQIVAADFDGNGFDDLAIGNSSGRPEACGRADDCGGVVVVLAGSADGPTLNGGQTWTSDSPGVPGVSEEYDQFGEVLAAGNLNADDWADLVIGAPYEDIGRRRDAGAVTVLYGSATGLSARDAQVWSQTSPQVKGRPRCGDSMSGGGIDILNFGKGSSDDLAIRNPADGVGGTVNVLYGTRAGVSNSDQLWHQDVPGIPSRARPGEGFGGGNYFSDCER